MPKAKASKLKEKTSNSKDQVSTAKSPKGKCNKKRNINSSQENNQEISKGKECNTDQTAKRLKSDKAITKTKVKGKTKTQITFTEDDN